jgi:hypothetical protein
VPSTGHDFWGFALARRHIFRRTLPGLLLLATVSGCPGPGNAGAGERPAADPDGAATDTPNLDGTAADVPEPDGTATDTPEPGGTATDTPEPVGPVTDPNGPNFFFARYPVPECAVVPNGALSGADALTMFVAVRNSGPGRFDKLVPVDAASDTGIRWSQNTTLSTGTEVNAMQTDLNANAYNRTHRFTFTVDPGNATVEKDESDNNFTISVHLSDRPISSTDVPCTSP